jgi:hypothetical protein
MTGSPPSSASDKMKRIPSDEERRTHPVLVLLAGFLSALLLLMACVCGGALWWFRPQIHDDPQRARELVAEIIDIEIPESFVPRGTIEWNLAFAIGLRGAYYERFVGDGQLTVVEVTSRMATDDDVRRHIRRTLLEKGGGGAPLVVDPSDSRTMVFEISGQETPFTFDIGRDPPSGRVFHLAEGVVNGKSGLVLLAVRVNEEHWDEDVIVEMIRSIGRR